MSEDGPDGPPAPPPAKRVQMNVRVPEQLRADVDARREPLGLSRDVWVERALRWALAQPPPTRVKGGHQLAGSVVARTVAGRTIDPSKGRRR